MPGLHFLEVVAISYLVKVLLSRWPSYRMMSLRETGAALLFYMKSTRAYHSGAAKRSPSPSCHYRRLDLFVPSDRTPSIGPTLPLTRAEPAECAAAAFGRSFLHGGRTPGGIPCRQSCSGYGHQYCSPGSRRKWRRPIKLKMVLISHVRRRLR